LPIYCVDKGEDKVVSISFDAAWGAEDTMQLIEILDKFQVKATFFVVGSWVDEFPDAVKALADAGHEIMNHSNSHPHMTQISKEKMKQEVEKCNEKISAITGKTPHLFRAPYGDYNNDVVQAVRECGSYTIQWSVDSLDWKDLSASEITKRVMSKLHPGAIVLFHNAALHTPEALPDILEKAQKKNISIEEIEENIKDIAGIRIICQFVEDIVSVVEIIRNRDDMKVLEERDYVTHSKESGYRSYHLIIEYELYMIDVPKKIKVEIQIRTLAMNFWGIIEHSLQYKYRGKMPEHISTRLLAAADAILMLDKEMSSVRDEILDAQHYMRQTDSIISEILNNIQNLYGVANKREIEKIQDEFYSIYEKNDLDKLERFCDELDVIAEGYRAQSMQEEM